jgi:hypothetical protein
MRKNFVCHGSIRLAKNSLLRCHPEQAKDLLFSRVENKADPSIAQNRATSG